MAASVCRIAPFCNVPLKPAAVRLNPAKLGNSNRGPPSPHFFVSVHFRRLAGFDFASVHFTRLSSPPLAGKCSFLGNLRPMTLLLGRCNARPPISLLRHTRKTQSYADGR